MAMTYIEGFARAWAKQRLEKLEVTVDKETGAATFSFFGRHAQISFKDAVLRDDVFGHVAKAIDSLLVINDPEVSRET